MPRNNSVRNRLCA